MEKVTIPIPPIEVQREIVRILDNFAELTAELTARKKQYEYYRDTLLTFGVHRGGTFDKQVWTATIADICKHIQSGGTPKAGNSDYYGGTIPWLRTQEVNWNEIYDTDVKITEQGLKNSSAKMIPENCVIVAMYGATAGKVAINKIPLTTNQACCNLEIDETKALYRYVFHWLSKEYLSLKALGQGSQSNINAQTVKQYPIPIPPLEVQQRIVTVLDNFDVICSDLNIGLPAEIEARKKQYEYYRDMLLTFAAADDIILTDRQTDRQTELNVIKLLQYVFGYAVVKLDDIVDFRNGKGHEKNIIDNGKYIVVNSKFVSTNGEVKKYSDQQICPLYKNDILMVMSDLPNGRALAKCYLVEENDKYTLNQRIGAFTVNRTHLISTKYLYYVLNRNRQLLRYDNGADQTNLRKNDILNISIAIPTIEEQQKITDILDRFDSICNDLSIGLPAEIEARKKQYEYYRDKLLTFKELQK